MTCHAARVTEEGGAHQLSFAAVTPEDAAQGYCALCLVCGSRYKNAVEWIVTTCTPRLESPRRPGGGR